MGSSQGNPEGYHLGYHRGAELGAEIGYYTGVVEHHLSQKKVPEKLLKSVEELRDLLNNFPKENVEDVDIIEYADKIRVKYKKLCAQLKVSLAYPETLKLTF